jgi:GNAT superfamily N-acetyltransferase
MIELIWRHDDRPLEPADTKAAKDHLEAQGLRSFSLEDAGRGIEARRALYELVRTGVLDAPGGDDFVSFESFDAKLFEPYYWRWPDIQILAADGDDWVGLSSVQLFEPHVAQLGITVVRRDFRRRGIARALKVLALSHVQARRIPSAITRNHPSNEPILRLNTSLGFTPR